MMITIPMNEPAMAARRIGHELEVADRSSPSRSSAGSVKTTPAEAVLMPEAIVWLMLFSTIEPRP